MSDSAKFDDLGKIASYVVSKLGITRAKMPKFKFWRASSATLEGWTGRQFIDQFAYVYTVERDNNGYFWAVQYRISKINYDEQWSLRHKSHRRSRKKARELAYKWYCERVEHFKKKEGDKS